MESKIPKNPSLSQVFLKSQQHIQRIVESLDIQGKDVLEIGPGDGRMTEHLLKQARKVVCVEVDLRFAQSLTTRFLGLDNLNIIQSDIRKVSLSEVGEKLVVFGNVPYHISNDLIYYLVGQRKQITSVWLTLQKEFAEKLFAKPGTKDYSFLSAYIQFYAQVKKLFIVPAGAFTPAPKVDSCFVEMTFYSNQQFAADENKFFYYLKKAFTQRRKKISNSLNLSQEQSLQLSCLGVSPASRPEDLSLEDWEKIYRMLTRKM